MLDGVSRLLLIRSFVVFLISYISHSILIQREGLLAKSLHSRAVLIIPLEKINCQKHRGEGGRTWVKPDCS